jgi:hypothetical protein
VFHRWEGTSPRRVAVGPRPMRSLKSPPS